MLALTTTDALTVIDPATLKNAPSSVPSCQPLLSKPTASSWPPDSPCLVVSSASNIQKYDPVANSLHNIYSTDNTEYISNLIAKDKGNTLIFSLSQIVHVLECSTGKITQSFDSHKSPITSLALSNDSTLLATTSANTAHVHNLTHGSHTVLRGLQTSGASINTCIFHAHSRTRVLLGVGRQLVVYDSTRPSGPMKTIAMSDGMAGQVDFVACSPFSKTLVAFATTAGSVFLVDLDKEKSIFRTINIKIPLTCLAFSNEGGALYLGTENGKLLVLDLRALDRPPKAIIIGDNGVRVESISVQRKTKAAVEPSTKSTLAVATKAQDPVRRPASAAAAKPVAKRVPKATAGPSPTRTRAEVGNVPSTPAPSPSSALTKAAMRKAAAKARVSPRTKAEPKKKVPVPLVKDPLRNSGGLLVEGSGEEPVRKRNPPEPVSPSPKTLATSTRSSTLSIPSGQGRPQRTKVESKKNVPFPAAKDLLRNSGGGSGTARLALNPQEPTSPSPKTSVTSTRNSTLSVPSGHGRNRAEPAASSNGTVSSVSAQSHHRTGSESQPRSRAGSSASRPGSSNPREDAAFLQVPNLLDEAHAQRKRKRSSSATDKSSRTPTPDLPGIDVDVDVNVGPVTPVATKKKRAGMNVLGLGTPAVDKWIAAGKRGGEGIRERKGKTVGFMDENQRKEDENAENSKGKGNQSKPSQALQISPLRPGPATTTSWVPSPLRNSTSAHLNMNANSQSYAPSAPDLLRTIVRDVMYDFQRETKAEMMGLHLDLVRMGRGWRHELRSLMDEYVGDLKDLREENTRLREENARLKRGY